VTNGSRSNFKLRACACVQVANGDTGALDGVRPLLASIAVTDCISPATQLRSYLK
jgi:hypothetical protein